jgi:hypothetical protein
MTENALIVVEKLNPAVLFTQKDEVSALIAEIEKQALAHVPVVDTDKGRKEVISMAAKVTRSKTLLDGMGKDLTADWKRKAKVVDASRKEIRDRLDALKLKVREPVTLWENAEKDRVAKHNADIETMRNLADPNNSDGEPWNAGMLRAKLAEVEGFEMGEIWEEFAGVAAKVKDESIAALKSYIERQEKYEAEQIELERLRKEAAEREKREYEETLKKEAAEKARVEAEQKAAEQAAKIKAERDAAERREREIKEDAERAKLAAEQAAKQAERDRIAAEERAKVEKEMAVRAAEEKVRQEAEMREKERLEKEAAAKADAERKAANVAHQKKINREALESLVSIGFGEDSAKQFISSVAKGLVKNITINY